MTEPLAWVDADEDVLRIYANAFASVSATVSAQLESARRERGEIFDGATLWSGGAADAAHGALQDKIAKLEARKAELDACAKLFSDSHAAITAAKNEITEIVTKANSYIYNVSESDLESDEKDRLIANKVKEAREKNLDAIDAQASLVSGSKKQNTTSQGEEGVGAKAADEGKANDQERHGIRAISNSVLPSDNAESSSSVEEDSGLSPIPDIVITDDSEMRASSAAELSEPSPSPGPVTIVGDGSERSSSGSRTDLTPSIPSPREVHPPHSIPAAPAGPGVPAMPGSSGAPAMPSPPGTGGAPSYPVSGSSSTSSSSSRGPGTSIPVDPAATTGQPQLPVTEFQNALSEATKAAVAQQLFIPPPAAASPVAGAPPPPVAPPGAPVEAAAQPVPTPTPPPSLPPAAPGGGLAGGAPIGGSGVGGPGGAPMPLGPPPSPSPAAPVASSGAVGPAVPPAAAGAASGAVAAAPVPVSAKRAERDAVAGVLRRASSSDPLEVARRIGAALNVGVTEPRLFWMTGLTTDGSILVANNYGVGYIPEGVNLPEQVIFVSADESIAAQERGKWATYPIMGLHGWAQAHDASLRAVIATEDQFKGTDPGAAAIVLQPDDLPADGRMEGRSRLAVIAPDVAAKLATMSDQALPELLPPVPVDPVPPENRRTKLLMEVFRPLLSSDPGRAPVQLQAMITFATHMQELSLHRAHTATDVVEQRAAICDWIYWQHLAVLTSDSVGGDS